MVGSTPCFSGISSETSGRGLSYSSQKGHFPSSNVHCPMLLIRFDTVKKGNLSIKGKLNGWSLKVSMWVCTLSYPCDVRRVRWVCGYVHCPICVMRVRWVCGYVHCPICEEG